MPQISRSVWIPLSIYRTCQLVFVSGSNPVSTSQQLVMLPVWLEWWAEKLPMDICPWLVSLPTKFPLDMQIANYDLFNFIHSVFPFTCKCSIPPLLRTHLSSSLSLLWCLNALFLLLYSNFPSYCLHVVCNVAVRVWLPPFSMHRTHV